MTVKDLFMCCDRVVLKKYFMEMDDVSADEKTVEHIFLTLEEEEAALSSDEVVLGAEFIDISDGLPRRIDVSMYKISEITDKFRYVELTDADSATKKEYDELNRLFSDIERYLIDLYEWKNILGFRIDKSNAEKLGYERFMAEILWSMTYYGYSEADIERKRREYSRTEAVTMSDSSASLDDMMSLLFGEMPLAEEEDEQINLENTANMLSSYNAIKEFYEAVSNK